MKKQTRFVSVWDAIEDTPQQAASMRARSDLLMNLQGWARTLCPRGAVHSRSPAWAKQSTFCPPYQTWLGWAKRSVPTRHTPQTCRPRHLICDTMILL